jgi:diguanylate cyclase (GGDEF)-like protein
MSVIILLIFSGLSLIIKKMVNIRKILYFWRYYSLEKAQYYKGLNNLFINNLVSLTQANFIVAVFAGYYALVSLIIEGNIIKSGICAAASVISILLAVFTNYKMQTQFVSNRIIYILTILFYINVMALSIYLSVWSSPDKLAAVFLCFIIFALLMSVNSPLFNLFLTIGAMIIFVISTIIIKERSIWIMDIINTLVAGMISLYFTWQINKLRLGLELSTSMLEDERNNYFDQSIMDELTQLRNRRDFQQTFKRYISNYRTSDNWLCIAILDIDFFKNYNDYYGHPKGDDCLRAAGKLLNSLRDSLDVYSARVGGEEFALLWFESDAEHVNAVVAHIQRLMKELQIPHEKSKVSPYVTVSIGIYVERCGVVHDTQILYDLADKALYSAKEGGRNCAIVSGNEIKQYKIVPQ